MAKISRWSAGALLVVGAFLAFSGALTTGAMAFGSAVLVWGLGSVAGGEDRAVGWVLVVAGAGSVIGVIGHLVSGVGA